MVTKVVVKAHSPKFQNRWFGPYRIQYYLPNNIILLMIIDKFGLNPILININKLKPHQFIEDSTFQLISFKTNDLLTKKPIETNRFCNMFDEKLMIYQSINQLKQKELTSQSLRNRLKPLLMTCWKKNQLKKYLMTLLPCKLKMFQLTQSHVLLHSNAFCPKSHKCHMDEILFIITSPSISQLHH